ncbi:MAG: putative sulfate exporter family transporter [Chloroflexi bacterium]|nr:putative sulfate exporter family transporter [Chloroflexota bacterium]MCL5276056.1 putative sulfate exporter family transporter [Chloroflexota bacterium]
MLKVWAAKNAPGIGLSVVIAISALLLQGAETKLLGQPVIEGLVIAILLGMIIRTFWNVSSHFQPGVGFSSKHVLHFAIVLLGITIDLPSLLKAGPVMLIAVIAVVFMSIFASSQIGRLFGLNPKLAILVACGNSICGNSAIAAIAPVIGAEKKDIASSIALTAVLGVVVVLTLPLLISMVGLSFYQYGVLAGMTVSAVPQVIAATYPVSIISGDIGTLVKLVRVLMLGPVMVFFALRFRQSSVAAPRAAKFSLTQFVPWFIIGFVTMATIRSLGLIPTTVTDPLREVYRGLTVVAMSALGLTVDIRVIHEVGRPVALAVIGSLLLLIAVSLVLIKVFGIAGV